MVENPLEACSEMLASFIREMRKEKIMSTNKFAIQVFLNEFPFIKNILKAKHITGEVEEVKVLRISPEFLDTMPWYTGATGSLVGIDDDERIFLLDSEGGLLLEVKQSRDITHNEQYQENELRGFETIGEALLRLDNPDKVVFALRVHLGYVVENHHSVGGFSITLFKAPKNFTLKGWVEEQLNREKTLLSATITEIDAEGVRN